MRSVRFLSEGPVLCIANYNGRREGDVGEIYMTHFIAIGSQFSPTRNHWRALRRFVDGKNFRCDAISRTHRFVPKLMPRLLDPGFRPSR